MKLSEFDYFLPGELIAQSPAEPRDHSRLLVLDKKTGELIHDHFYNLCDYLRPGDLLVVNNSKVFPARLFGKRDGTNGNVEILLNKNLSSNSWEVIGKNLKPKSQINFDNSLLKAQIIQKKDKIAIVEFNLSGEQFFDEIDKIGHTPLPPYIKKVDTKEDKVDYQTVYAKPRGSAAAPTAGLHFTQELLDKINAKGVSIAEVTLHVGLGTFAPVETEEIENHQIHSEYYSVKPEEMAKIVQAKKEKRRVIAVGTTSTRVLETIFQNTSAFSCQTPSFSGWTKIYIYPGFEFKSIDGLITNFHLPKSSLLMLVSALAGKKNIDHAYTEAVKEKYRFFSYGDAMLIL